MASGRPARSAGRSVWAFLRANDLAIVLSLLLALLFAGASFVREASPGSYARLRGDDLRFFLESFRLIDLWFWLIAAGLLLLGISLGVCALETLRRRQRLGRLGLWDLGSVLAHIGVGVALLAHAIGGIGGSEAFTAVTDTAREVGPYRVRLLDATTELHPDGTVARQSARLGVVDRAGKESVRFSAANDPARWDSGREMLLLLRVEEMPGRCVLLLDGRRDTLQLGEIRSLDDGGRLVVERLFGPPAYRVPVAQVRILGGARKGTHLIGRGVAGGVEGIEILEAVPVPVAIVSYRHAPATPWLVGAAFLFTAGVVLTGLRWWRIVRRRRITDPIDGLL